MDGLITGRDSGLSLFLSEHLINRLQSGCKENFNNYVRKCLYNKLPTLALTQHSRLNDHRESTSPDETPVGEMDPFDWLQLVPKYVI